MFVQLDELEAALIVQVLRTCLKPVGAAQELANRIEARFAEQKDVIEAFARAAQEQYASLLPEGDLDWDDDPTIARGESGAYVMGWLFVTNEEAGLNQPIADTEDQSALTKEEET